MWCADCHKRLLIYAACGRPASKRIYLRDAFLIVGLAAFVEISKWLLH
jgi:hypothetical protein